ncbi:MAG: NAD(P)-dependent oxidoreductase [Burkholderiales bacterium]|nr:NAD(P)-dependent oxidoreductase [Burkholderiales bacterium]
MTSSIKLPPVGLIGPGAMGLGITRALLRRGFPVHVRDLDPARNALAQAAGAVVESSPAAVAAKAGIVISVVVDAAQTDEVCFGADGIVAGLQKGGVVMVCSTVAPTYMSGLADRLAGHALLAVDAPISGGPARAESGTMSMMIAGSDEALELCADVLAAMSDKRFVIGPTPGQGSTMKLVNNLLAGIHNAAAAEAMSIGLKAGLDANTIYDVVMASSGASWMFGDRMRRWIDHDDRVAAALPILTKDVGLALEMAKGMQFPLPVGASAHQVFLGTLALGHALDDDNSLIHYYRAMTGVELP